MKVFVLTISYKGLCHYSAHLVNALGHHCDATLLSPKGTRGYVEEPGKVVEIDYPFHRYDPRYHLRLLQIISLIRREKPDVVHLQDLHPVLLALTPFFGKAKLVQTLHDVSTHPGEEVWYHKYTRVYATRKADAVVVHGEHLRDALIKEYPWVRDKVRVIHHGPNVMFRRWYKSDVPEEKNILCFGRMVKYKGIDVLLKAAPKIREALPDYTITIAGGADGSAYLPLANSLGDYVDFQNRIIPDEEVAELYQRCSIAVAPYIEASQSGALLTAYAFGKPVVATNVGSLPEVVEDGKTGFLVQPGDPDALADAIIRLANDPELRKSMSLAIGRKIEAELNWDVAARKTVDMYRHILDRR